MKIKKVSRFYNQSAGDAFCFDDCIFTYASDRKADIGMIYLRALRLPFDIVNHEIVPNGFQLYEELEKVSGIRITTVCGSNNEERKSNVIKELKRTNKVLIGIEGNCCPWDWRFGEMELAGGHAFFLCGVDEEKEEFICADPYYDIAEERLPYKYFVEGVTSARVFSFKDGKKWSEDEILKAIEVEKTYWDTDFEKLKGLGNQLDRIIELAMEASDVNNALRGNYEDLNQNAVYKLFEEISNNGIRFVWFLQYLREKGIAVTEDCIEQFVDISKLWNTLKKMLVKGVIRGKIDIQGFADKINEIIEHERAAVDKLVYMVNNKNVQDSCNQGQLQDDSDENVKYVPYDLSSLYNNAGFSSSANADFSGFGEAIEESSLPIGKEIVYKDTPLIIYKSESEFDNIVCRKQTVELPYGKITGIYILACSDWEEYKEFFQLQYEDAPTQNVAVDVYDWLPDRNGRPENVCITAKKNIQRSKSKYEKCYLYCCKIKCDHNKFPKAVMFPNNENIHILAMTVAVKSEKGV